ncbi:MAG: twin-arginine translocase subunit TatC [Proteobacteria bacterium]|nr:twin-arginine translocase subunit TatC [Pseudomonadota bacterium]
MPFTAHLAELRKRLIVCLIAVAAGFGICYYFAQPIFKVMMLPLLDALPEGRRQLIYTGLPEAFFTYLKVGFWGGVVLAVPVISHQLWGFIAPGLYRKERGYLIPFILFSTLLFVVGGLFGYFVVFPFGFQFFLGFTDETITALPSVQQYFSLALKLLLGFGLIFELPLVMVFLGKMGIVNAPLLARGRKYAIILIFVVAAILTPPDVVSQVLMAIPLLFLYEISILLVRMIQKKKAES